MDILSKFFRKTLSTAWLWTGFVNLVLFTQLAGGLIRQFSDQQNVNSAFGTILSTKEVSEAFMISFTVYGLLVIWRWLKVYPVIPQPPSVFYRSNNRWVGLLRWALKSTASATMAVYLVLTAQMASQFSSLMANSTPPFAKNGLAWIFAMQTITIEQPLLIGAVMLLSMAGVADTFFNILANTSPVVPFDETCTFTFSEGRNEGYILTNQRSAHWGFDLDLGLQVKVKWLLGECRDTAAGSTVPLSAILQVGKYDPFYILVCASGYPVMDSEFDNVRIITVPPTDHISVGWEGYPVLVDITKADMHKKGGFSNLEVQVTVHKRKEI